MKSPTIQTGTNSDNGSPSHKEHPAATALPSGGQETIADLTAMVKRALDLADALRLGLVGIDLCSALERLYEIGEAEHSSKAPGLE